MRVCEVGHYVGKKRACRCGGAVESGHKVSLFLPDELYCELRSNAAAMGDSISVQIVSQVRRGLDRKRK